MISVRGKDLYILQMEMTGDIKVGRSKHVHQRIKELQTGCPHRLRLILHAPDEGHRERDIHRMMGGRHLRRNGEWFDVERHQAPPRQDTEPHWFDVLTERGLLLD